MATTAQPTTSPTFSESVQLPIAPIIQSFHLVWLDRYIHENNEKRRNIIMQFREVVNTINIFADVDLCIDFITDIEETAFVILSEEFSEMLIPIFLKLVRVNKIYIFCENNPYYETYVKKYPIVDVYTDIPSICEALRKATQAYDQNALPISFMTEKDSTTKQDLDRLDCSFMYTQLLKDIILTLDFNQEHFQEFIAYCRQLCVANASTINIDKFEKDYKCEKAIWWYTYPSFLYSMLNRALRILDVTLIVNIAFFIRDLHNRIVELHTLQYPREPHLPSFTVYRGQGLSQEDFHHLKATKKGLLAFNSFLSTSPDRAFSVAFAESNIQGTNQIGVLFVITIDPSKFATVFANIEGLGYFKDEPEILFSMHSVFRIDSIRQLDNTDRLWEIKLNLTNDNDAQLHTLKQYMETDKPHSNGWVRLIRLLIHLNQFDKAYQLCDVMLHQSNDQTQYAFHYSNLGIIKLFQGHKTQALSYQEKVLEILQKTLPANHLNVAISYNNIALMHYNMGEYSKALSYYEKALEIEQKTLPANHPSFTVSYNNIALVHYNMGEYSKALSYYEKTLEIQQRTLPANHPDVATFYSNIGTVYIFMGEYLKALLYYEKTLEIQQRTLPANHSSLATFYNNIGTVYYNIGKPSRALSYYEKAQEILQKTRLANHPDITVLYNNIGMVYYSMGEYWKAFSYCEKALEIEQKTLPANHPSLAISYKNIASVYEKMG